MIWFLGIADGLPLGRFFWGTGTGSAPYLTGSGSPESESLGKDSERMLHGRSSASNPARPGGPTLSMSSKATNPLGLWVKAGLAVRLVVTLGGDGLLPREAEPLWGSTGGDAEGGGRGWV